MQKLSVFSILSVFLFKAKAFGQIFSQISFLNASVNLIPIEVLVPNTCELANVIAENKNVIAEITEYVKIVLPYIPELKAQIKNIGELKFEEIFATDKDSALEMANAKINEIIDLKFKLEKLLESYESNSEDYIEILNILELSNNLFNKINQMINEASNN